MSADLTTIRLEQLGPIVTGKTPPKSIESAFDQRGTPFITPKDMDGRKWIDATERYLSELGLNAVKNSIVPRYSVAVSCIGSDMGKAVLVDCDSVTNQQINTILVDSEKWNPEYIYYLLSTKQQLLKDIAGGSATPILNKGHFGKVEIEVPSKELQDEAARILSAIDEKIHLNRQTNQTLEQIAQAIFKSWFVDFDPVKAKISMLEAGGTTEQAELAAMSAISAKDEATLKQLQAEQPAAYAELAQTAALFPSAMVDSELGDIPEGWEIKLSGEIMDVRDGTHDSPKRSDVGYPLVTSKHITTGVLALKDAYLISEEDYLKIKKRSNVSCGDILLTMIGTVGIPYLISQRSINFAIKNVGLFRTSEQPLIRNYFFLLLKSDHMQGYLDARMAGTTQKYLSLKSLRTIEVLLPPENILAKFNLCAESVFEQIFSNVLENETLSFLRDALLPKLLSGELIGE